MVPASGVTFKRKISILRLVMQGIVVLRKVCAPLCFSMAFWAFQVEGDSAAVRVDALQLSLLCLTAFSNWVVTFWAFIEI